MAESGNDVTRILKTPAVVETPFFRGVEPMLLKQDEFPAFVKSAPAKYERVIKDSGARID